MILKSIHSKIIKDSRGVDTIAISVNNCEWASSPNGKSVGDFETTSYYKSLRFCVNFLNKFSEKIKVSNFSDLAHVERAICKKLKLKNARMFGANALYAFESAILKALAHEKGKELFEIVNSKSKKLKMPLPVGNVIGGGVHSSSVKKHPDFQEFLVIPRSKKFSDNLKAMNYMHNYLMEKFGVSKVNDEGGLLATVDDSIVFDVLNKCRIDSGKKFKFSIGIGIDAASSSFFKRGLYNYSSEKINSLSQLSLIKDIIINNSISYMEDPFHQRDFDGFAKLLKKVGKKCLIVGDDLTATEYDRVVSAIKNKSINALIIKPNQNGSLLELKKIFGLCKKKRIKTVLSHRSGETMDDALADYAVGFGADYIKCGVVTKWREVKLNRLAEIERLLWNI